MRRNEFCYERNMSTKGASESVRKTEIKSLSELISSCYIFSIQMEYVHIGCMGTKEGMREVSG